jgi:CheY-like chemotaxis protein
MALLKILIAEDEKVTQKIYQASLPVALCQHKIVGDGEEAIRVYNEWKPDVVLLDFGLPHLNGYQVLKTIRGEHRDKDTVIIMVTGQSDKESIVACAKLGVQGYIVKPFVNKDLAPKIFKIYRENKKAGA